MTEHAIIFGGHSVQMSRAGKKTQTRRVISRTNCVLDGRKPISPEHWAQMDFEEAWVVKWPNPEGNAGPYLQVPCLCEGEKDMVVHRLYPRVQLDDTLRVRERWGVRPQLDGVRPSEISMDEPVYYHADPHSLNFCFKYRAALHMPKWMSRDRATVKDVRFERLQDISDNACFAEGYPGRSGDQFNPGKWLGGTESNGAMYSDMCDSVTWFRHHWDSINAKRGHPWEKNDWLLVYFYELRGEAP